MTNWEWLLNMGGEERQAWFDAEHEPPAPADDPRYEELRGKLGECADHAHAVLAIVDLDGEVVG